MESKAFDRSIIKKQSKEVIKYIYIIGAVLISVFIFKIIRGNDNVTYVTSIAFFTRTVNSLMGIISIVSCLILYKKTKDSILYILSLVYVGLSIAIITGQLDYNTFFYNEFTVNKYISVTTALLRIVILFIAIIPNSNIYKFISKNKIKAFIFVASYSIIVWQLEKIFFENKLFNTANLLYTFNTFICIAYSLTAIKLLLISIKRSKIVIGAFSISLFLIAIKSFYIVYSARYNSFNMKLISALLTYVSFFTVIIGAVTELYLLYKESQYLNRELKKFYNLANFNDHSYMFICDKDCNISFINNKIKKDYDYKIDNNKFKEELLSLIPDRSETDKFIEQLYNENSWRGLVSSLKRGAMVDCSVQLIDTEDDEKQILVAYNDISENIKLHAEIEAHKINDIKKSEFISTLSHELKTPLNIFYSILQLLDKTEAIGIKEFKETYDKYSDTLKLNSKRMLRLANNIVDSTKIDTGIFKAEFGNYEIVSIIEDIVMSTVPFAQSKNIRVEFDTNIEEHFIQCDPTMIQRIVLNLVSNSIKYTNNEGLIKIEIILRNDILEILFEDTGIGIPGELKDKIFDRFSRVDSSLKRVNEGSGIGLNIVKSMVEVQNGSIEVNSVLNKGSVFRVKLPNVLMENSPMVIYEFNKANTELELSDIYS